MTEFTVHTTINAPVAQVWAALSDIGSIYQWNPGVVASHTTTEQTEGVGACRHCDLGKAGYLDESVVKWVENEALTMRINGTNMPFRSADIRFTLQPQGDQTVVTCSPIYTLKYGPIGKLLDAAMVRSTYQKGMQSLLAGLKQHVEAA